MHTDQWVHLLGTSQGQYDVFYGIIWGTRTAFKTGFIVVVATFLIGIVIASLVNIFLHSSALQFVVSIIGVIVFTGLTAYDTQNIKSEYSESYDSETQGKLAISGALRLYLDFINLFMMLLQLFGQRR